MRKNKRKEKKEVKEIVVKPRVRKWFLCNEKTQYIKETSEENVKKLKKRGIKCLVWASGWKYWSYLSDVAEKEIKGFSE